MKKSKKIGLSLNKKVVSALKSNQLQGGSSNNFTLFCTVGCPSGGDPNYTANDGSWCKCL